MPDWKTAENKDSLPALIGFGWNHTGGHNMSCTSSLAIAGVTVPATNCWQITNTEGPKGFLPDDTGLVTEQRLHAFWLMSIWWVFNTLWLPWPAAFCSHWMLVLLLYLDYRAKGLSCGENCNVKGTSVWPFCISLFTKPFFVAQVKGLENSTL